LPLRIETIHLRHERRPTKTTHAAAAVVYLDT